MTDTKLDAIRLEALTPEELTAVSGGHKNPAAGAGGSNKTGQLGNYSSRRYKGRRPG
jgi:hypothetical protein